MEDTGRALRLATLFTVLLSNDRRRGKALFIIFANQKCMYLVLIPLESV